MIRYWCSVSMWIIFFLYVLATYIFLGNPWVKDNFCLYSWMLISQRWHFCILIDFLFVVFSFRCIPSVTFSLMHWTDLAIYLYSESHYCWRVGFVRTRVSVWDNLATVTLSAWIYLFSSSLWKSPIILSSKKTSKVSFIPFTSLPSPIVALKSIWILT